MLLWDANCWSSLLELDCLAPCLDCDINQLLSDVDVAIVIDADFGDDIDRIASTNCVVTNPN